MRNLSLEVVSVCYLYLQRMKKKNETPYICGVTQNGVNVVECYRNCSFRKGKFVPLEKIGRIIIRNNFFAEIDSKTDSDLVKYLEENLFLT